MKPSPSDSARFTASAHGGGCTTPLGGFVPGETEATVAACPNEHGVYEPSETISLPNPKANWRGCALAEIDLLELTDGWRMSTAAQTSTRGHCGPITARTEPHPSRETAILAGIAEHRRWLASCADPQTTLISTWLDTLIPEQPDLFGAAA